MGATGQPTRKGQTGQRGRISTDQETVERVRALHGLYGKTQSEFVRDAIDFYVLENPPDLSRLNSKKNRR